MEEKPTTAFTLSLIAGVLILLGATMSLIFAGIMRTWWDSDMSGMMGWWSGFSIPLSVAGLAFGVIVIYAAIMLNSKPAQHATWGTLILVFSLLSVIGAWAGFGLGLILGIVGGALAISWSPTTPTAPTQPPGRYCTHCGRAVPTDAKFCPHCSKELPT